MEKISAAGAPARVVRYRFDPETIARLLAIQWWEWNDKRILYQFAIN